MSDNKFTTQSPTTTTANDEPSEKLKRMVVLANNTNTNLENDTTASGTTTTGPLLKIKMGSADQTELVKKIYLPVAGDKPKSIEKITIQAVNPSTETTTTDEKSDGNKTTYVIKKQPSVTEVPPIVVTSATISGDMMRSKKINLAQQPLVSVMTAQNKTIMVKMLPHNFKALPQKTLPPAEEKVVASKVVEEEVLLETDTLTAASRSEIFEGVVDFESSQATIQASSSDLVPSASDDMNSSFDTVSHSSSSKESLTIKTTGIVIANTPPSANSPKIHREIKALKRMQDSSKILTEFISDSTEGKVRKSRKQNGGDDDSTGSRSRSQSRGPINRERSESTDHGRMTPGFEEKLSPTRRSNMRSANSEFSLKQKKFLTQIVQNDENTDNSDAESTITTATSEPNGAQVVENDEEMVAKTIHPPPKPGWDKFCWRCHQDGEMVACSKCIRSYHIKCLKSNQLVADMSEWACPECLEVELGQSREKSKYKKEKLTVECLNYLLGFALRRFKQLKGCDILHKLITKSQHPDHEDYIEKNVDLKFMEQRVAHSPYQSTDEFISDCKWVLHNTLVYPRLARHILAAKSLVRQCKMEMNEIDTCPECYENANTKKSWFVEVCSRPHILLWAKLKGFPYWPAKAMATNASLVDVRFFGKHDKAWLPVKDCYLYSANDPNQPKKYKNNNIAECIKEVDVYVQNLQARFGKFNLGLVRVSYDPAHEAEQWLELLPFGRKEFEAPSEMQSQKTDLRMKIYKTADNLLSISKVDTKTSENGVMVRTKSVPNDRRRKSSPVEEMLAMNTPQPPNKIKILERHTSDGKNKTYQILKEDGVDQLNKTAPAGKLEPVKLKRNLDSWSNSSKAPPAKKQRMNSDEKEKSKEEVEGNENSSKKLRSRSNSMRAKSPSPTKSAESVHAVNSPPKQPVSVRDEKEVHTETTTKKILPVKRITRNKSQHAPTTSSPSAKLEKGNKRTRSTNRDASEEEPKVEEPTEDVTGLLTRSRRKSMSIKSINPNDQASPERISNGKEKSPPAAKDGPKNSKVVTEKTNAIEKSMSESSGSLLVPITSNGDFEAVHIKEEPISDDESQQMANITTESENFLTSTPATTPLNRPLPRDLRSSDRIVVKDINQMTTSQKKKGQSPIAAQRRQAGLSQLKTEPPSSPGFFYVSGRKSSPSQRARKTFPYRSRFHAPAFGSNATSRFAPAQAGGFQAMKQPNNMVYIPINAMSTMNLTGLPNDVPPLAVVSQKVSHFKKGTNPTFTGRNPSQPPAVTATTTVATPPNEQSKTPQLQQSQAVPLQQQTVPALVAPRSVVTSVTTSPSTNPPLLQPLQSDQQKQQLLPPGFMVDNALAAMSSAPPKLTCRPSGALRSDGDFVYPSEAGPVSRILIDNSHKMADFFRSVIEDTLADLSNNGQTEAHVRLLEMEIEKIKYAHAQELATLKHNTEMVICEMRKNLEGERTRLINDVRKQCELERIRAVEETKKKQWCTNCGKEAQFHCCWNTSYCDYPCQEQHWQRHMTSCNQLQQQQQQQQIFQQQQHHQQQQHQQQSLNKSRGGNNSQPTALVQLQPTPVNNASAAAAAAARLQSMYNTQKQPNSQFYTLVQNRQNGKFEMVCAKSGTTTNGGPFTNVSTPTNSTATSVIAQTVVNSYPALIQLSAPTVTTPLVTTTVPIVDNTNNPQLNVSLPVATRAATTGKKSSLNKTLN